MNEVLLLTHPQKYVTELLRIISRFSKRIMGLFELIVEIHCVSWNSYYNFYRFLVRITALTKYANIIFLFVNEKKNTPWGYLTPLTLKRLVKSVSFSR